uniref:Protein kinase domain-containing protein n=1 Tax=Rhabditophanes sp. KR3021 TaxID=114890 RepID=A0AC35U9A6_9BILA
MTLSGETITSTDKLIKSLNVPSSEYVARYNNVMQQIGKIKTSEREFEDVTLNDLVHVSDIGAGMFGTVMKMQFVPTKEYFAVKHIILDEKNNDLRRIIMECYVLLDFSCHENIITCYGVLKKDTGLYLCMELMNSCLETLIKQHYKMGLEEKFVGKFTVNIVDGLDYLKENYIMHRDIKPSNLLLDQHGVIKICDFGISGILVNTVINTSNETGSVKYMAPERIDTKDPYDYRADIWSVGITVYEMINGFTPYDKEGSTFAVFATIKKGKEPRFVKDQVSPELEDFTHRCLTSLPANRPTYKILKEHLFIKESRKAQVRMEDLFNYMK